MADQNSVVTEKRFYPVLFMILLSVIFIGILAVFYFTTLDRVESHRIETKRRDILELFELPTGNLNEEFDRHIEEISNNGFTYYSARKDSVLLGYCFPITGKGLWGTIKALLALDPEMKTIKGLEILEQNETPGLGGRIVESWFKDQFKAREIVSGNRVLELNLVPQDEQGGGRKIQQITGATSSSRAVVKMIRTELLRISRQLGLDYE